ncbi:MAG: hypothetical protein Q9188_001869 [Gyalolechia gomerana]
MSATLLLLRLIAGAPTKTTRLSLYALMVVFATIALTTIFAVWLQCIPIAASWDPRLRDHFALDYPDTVAEKETSRVEENVGTIACSIPALYPLIKSTLRSRKGGNPEGTPKSTFFVPSWDSRRVRILGLNQPASNSGKPRSESASEERILAPAEDVIRKTTDIRLDYSSRKAARQDHDKYIEMV